MPDREKIIEGQIQVILHLHRMSEVAYDGDVSYYEDLRDKAGNALDLLNGQEPLTIQLGRVDEIYNYIAECPECGMEWAMWHSEKMRFCPGCGKAVKWNADD